MGTSTLSAKQRLKRNHDKVIIKDRETTTASLGFRVTGFVIKDKNGLVKEKIVKPHSTVKAEHIQNILEKILKSNDLVQINNEALLFCKQKT